MSRGATVTVCKSFSLPALDRPQRATYDAVPTQSRQKPWERSGTAGMSKMPFARAGRLSMAAPPGMPETRDG